jgi:hypothetical protein
MDKQTDGELMAQLLFLLAEGAAVGAKALDDAPSSLVGRWLTNSATSFVLAAGSGVFLEQVQLSPVARARIEAFLAIEQKLVARPEPDLSRPIKIKVRQN